MCIASYGLLNCWRRDMWMSSCQIHMNFDQVFSCKISCINTPLSPTTSRNNRFHWTWTHSQYRNEAIQHNKQQLHYFVYNELQFNQTLNHVIFLPRPIMGNFSFVWCVPAVYVKNIHVESSLQRIICQIKDIRLGIILAFKYDIHSHMGKVYLTLLIICRDK